MNSSDIKTIKDVADFCKERLPKDKIELKNLKITSYRKCANAIYFYVVNENNQSEQFVLWLRKEIFDKYKDENLFLLLNAEVTYVSGTLSIFYTNFLELDVEKIEIQKDKKVLPLYCCNIAVISNSDDNGQGYQDFTECLHYGRPHDFNAKVGNAHDIAKQINDINKEHEKYDCICIIRGGGDDIKNIDTEELADAVRNSEIPIILGIGHTNNKLSFGKYAVKECRNPTEAAYYINERFERLESEIKEKLEICRQYIDNKGYRNK